MKKICDLHTHSVFSDGTWTPEQLVQEAERIGLSAIALTDHNTVEGLPRFLMAAEGKNLEAVPGVEFSTEYLGMDIHVVAHYVMPEVFPTVREKMGQGRRKKDESNRELIENLRRIGFSMDYDAMKASVPSGQINRAHIAAEMVKRGWVSTMQEAFQRYLEPELGLYNPPHRPGIFEMFSFIRSIGAVSILAHPFLKLSPEQVEALIPKAKEAGLLGMETEYVSFDEEKTARAKAIAARFGLLESGGSDFHGDNKPGIFLGVGRGNLQVPLSFLEAIRSHALPPESDRNI